MSWRKFDAFDEKVDEILTNFEILVLDQFFTSVVNNLIEKIKFFKTSKIIALSQENIKVGSASLRCNLKDKEHSYISVQASNSSRYHIYLMLPRTGEQFKASNFLHVDENTERLTFLCLEKEFEKTEKVKFNTKKIVKIYLLHEP